MRTVQTQKKRFEIPEGGVSRVFTTPFKTGTKYLATITECDFGPSRRDPNVDRLKLTFVAEHPTTGNEITTWFNVQWTEQGLQIAANDLRLLLEGALGAESPELATWFSDLGDVLRPLQTAVEDGTLHSLLVGNTYEISGDVTTADNGNQNYRIRSIKPVNTPKASPPRVAPRVDEDNSSD